MTSTQQRAELQRQIWQIANDVRGSIDDWDFKQYVLGTLFYRFISENFAAYIEGGDKSINYVETVISLAPNLFYGTSIVVNILVLSKHKNDNKTQFIDASKLFKKETNTNVLTDEHITQLLKSFDNKDDVEYFANSVGHDAIAENDYNLSVSAYVEAEDTREEIDITKLNAELKTTVAKIDQLRSEIDTIVAEIEGVK